MASQLERGPPSSACPVRSPVCGSSEPTSECVAGGRKSAQIGRPAGRWSGLDIEQLVHLWFASTGPAVTNALGHRVEGERFRGLLGGKLTSTRHPSRSVAAASPAFAAPDIVTTVSH